MYQSRLHSWPGTAPVPGLGMYLELRCSNSLVLHLLFIFSSSLFFFCHSPRLREVGNFFISDCNFHTSPAPITDQSLCKNIPQGTFYYLTLCLHQIHAFTLKVISKYKEMVQLLGFSPLWLPNMWFSWSFQQYPLVITAQLHHLKTLVLSSIFSSQLHVFLV